MAVTSSSYYIARWNGVAWEWLMSSTQIFDLARKWRNYSERSFVDGETFALYKLNSAATSHSRISHWTGKDAKFHAAIL